jgi:hypothetical protein
MNHIQNSLLQKKGTNTRNAAQILKIAKTTTTGHWAHDVADQ